jgi:hypothetical protein
VTTAWPWLMLAGLGFYHGLNPAMGWLFAVALGLHRRSRAVVLGSLVPIGLGHAASIALVAALVVVSGTIIDPRAVQIAGGVALIAWAGYHLLYGSRHRARVGMQAGFAGLALWSFLMASAHGAGLMVVPALMPLCLSPEAAGAIGASGSGLVALAAVAVHSAAMLATTGLIALIVYEWLDLGFLRRFWLNLDRLWVGALAGTGLLLIVL